MHSRIFVVACKTKDRHFSVSEEDARCINPSIDYVFEENEEEFNDSIDWLSVVYPNELIIDKEKKTWTITKNTQLIYFAGKYENFIDKVKEIANKIDSTTLEQFSGINGVGLFDLEMENYLLKNLYDDKDGFIIYIKDTESCVSLDYFIRNIEYYVDPKENPTIRILGSYNYHA